MSVAMRTMADEALKAWRENPVPLPPPVTETRTVAKASDTSASRESGPIVFAKLHGTATNKRARLVNLRDNPHGGWMLRPQPFRRMVSWLVNAPFRLWSLGAVLVSGNVSRDAYDKREISCSTCPDRHLIVTEHSTQSYCGLCGCPPWLLSRLSFKNRKRGWYCPARRHEGEYPDHRLRTKLVALGLATYDDLDRVGGGCVSCGGSTPHARAGTKG